MVPHRPLVRNSAYGSSAKDRKARQKNKRNIGCYSGKNQRTRPNSAAEGITKNNKGKVTSGGEEGSERKKSMPPLTAAISSTVSMSQFRSLPRKEPLDIVVIRRTISRKHQNSSCILNSEDDDTSSCSSSYSSELSFVSSSCSSGKSCLSPFLQQSSALSSSFSSQESSIPLPKEHKNVGKRKFHQLKKQHPPRSICAISAASSSIELPPPRNRTKTENYVLLSTTTTFSSASCSSYSTVTK